MEPTRVELKAAARRIIAETRPRPIKMTLIYLLIVYGVSALSSVVTQATGGNSGYDVYGVEMSFGMLGMFLGILTSLFSAVMAFGYIRYSLRLADREETGTGDLFSGFADTGRVILLNIILFGFYLAWALMVMVPGVVLSMLFTMAIGIAGGGASRPLVIIVSVVLGIAILLVLMYLYTRYTLAEYVLADDENVSPLNAVRRGRVLVRGRIKELFLLQFSFLGWNLLAVLIVTAVTAVGTVITIRTGSVWAPTIFSVLGSFSILPLMLWLQPYMCVTLALYYRLRAPRAEGETLPLPEAETPWRAGNS